MKVLILVFTALVYSSISFAQNQPCSSDTHRAFDFWLGDWEVTDATGKLAGENSITSIQNGCVLQENWTGAKGGFTGTSYNFFNTTENKWQQLWLDNQGGNLQLSGTRVENQMILETKEAKNKEGKLYIHRITWTKNDDGSVRQLWETISEGKVINVAFDGLYKKRR